MYIESVPNRGSPPTVLLRECYREGKKIIKRTLSNISHWPKEQIESFRLLLRGQSLVPAAEAYTTEESLPHGHVQAVLGTLRKIGLESFIASKGSRQRDLVVAMVVEQLLHGDSKLADTRLWHTSTLAEELQVGDSDEEDLYQAMDWLLGRQKSIQKKLARQHLEQGAMAFYDISSSFYYGRCCPLAKLGNDRDKKKGLPIITYGVMTDRQGRPISVQVYDGTTADPVTVPEQANRLQKDFGLTRVVLVGDRGMLTEVQIAELRRRPGLGWISALRTHQIRQLVEEKALQMSLFDEQNLAEIKSSNYPDEQLVACYNPLLAQERRRKRKELLEQTEKNLARILREVRRRTKKPLKEAEIGIKVGKALKQYKMGKHFKLKIAHGLLEWERDQVSIDREEHLDGVYIVRTSEPPKRLSGPDTVRHYKNLSRVEQFFRTCKGLDVRIRPIRHWTEDHVRAHIFLCMLAYYVEWHMRQALAPLLFEDEEIDRLRWQRDPVAKAQPSSSAQTKKTERITSEGLPVHSFKNLLTALATRCRNRCRVSHEKADSTFTQITKPNPLQQRALELLGLG